MSFTYGSNRKREPPKQPGRLASLFGSNQRAGTVGSDGAGNKRPIQTSSATKVNTSDLMPQGKGIKTKFSDNRNLDMKKLASAAENDERYKYLLKNGVVRRVEDDDRIIYAELPQIPGVLVVYRKPSDRNTNSERLNLDKRDLDHLPLLEGEERLRLLNFQHNQIRKIENLVSLPNLIFLDLYDNRIAEISHLHTVPTLRVLMLGKNAIDKIRNLHMLVKLDVLDLHSNKIARIEGLENLRELRVLNLANNQITTVENMRELQALTEVNFRKNMISVVQELDALPKLQRVFLSNNRLESFGQLGCLQQCQAMAELTLDGNPVHDHPDYVSWILANCPSLKHLDLKKVTGELRDSYAGDTNGDEENKQPPTNSENKDISNTPTPDPTTPVKPAMSPALDPADIQAEETLQAIQEEWRREMARISASVGRKDKVADCIVQSAHAVLDGETTLIACGNALEVLTDEEFYSKVTVMQLRYIRFDFVAKSPSIALLQKFGSLKTLELEFNNVVSFIHLSKLESLTQLRHLSVTENDVIHTVLFRSYVVYRFPHVLTINEQEVSETDKRCARQQFQQFDKTLSTPTIFNRPDAQVSPKSSAKNAEFAQQYISLVIVPHAEAINQKLDAISEMWDRIVYDTVHQGVLELAGLNEPTEETLLSLLNSPSVV